MGKWSVEQTAAQLESVESLLVQGLKSHKKIAQLVQQAGHGAIGPKRTAALIQRVHEIWATEDSGNRETRRAAAIRRIYLHLRKTAGNGKPGDANYVKPSWHATTQLEELLSKIEGTQEPSRSKLEINNNITQSLAYVIGSMTAEDAATLVAEQAEVEQLAAQQRKVQTSLIAQFTGSNGGTPQC